MAKYGKTARSSAFQWFTHRITGTFLVFLLITHFWVQHYDRQTASIAHLQVVTDDNPFPIYPEEATEAVIEQRARLGVEKALRPVAPVAQGEKALAAPITSYDVLMLRLGDPVYAVLWKGFNILFLLFALHHGFYGLNNVLTDYIRNDMVRVAAVTLSWTVALVLLVIGLYSIVVAGINL